MFLAFIWIWLLGIFTVAMRGVVLFFENFNDKDELAEGQNKNLDSL